jgi:hypothetical protein
MFRRTLIAIAAAASLAIGLGAVTAPAEAGHRHGRVNVFIGAPFVGFYHQRGYSSYQPYYFVKVRKHHRHQRHHRHVRPMYLHY